MNPVKIKDFGNDHICNSIEELKKTIQNNFINRSISIVITKPSGIQIPNYITVDEKGNLKETYTEKTVSFESFFNF